MAVEGSLDLFGLPEILQMISQQHKTGILTIQGQQDIVAVSFLGGKIVAADALTHTVEEGLSQLLVSEGLLDAAQFARASAQHKATGGRLLDLLVEGGYLTRTQLLDALRLQTTRQLEQLLHWDQGDFKFYSGDEVSYEDGFVPISVEDLLLRTLQDWAEPAPDRAAGAAAGHLGGAPPGAPGQTQASLPPLPRLPALPSATPVSPAPPPNPLQSLHSRPALVPPGTPAHAPQPLPAPGPSSGMAPGSRPRMSPAGTAGAAGSAAGGAGTNPGLRVVPGRPQERPFVPEVPPPPPGARRAKPERGSVAASPPPAAQAVAETPLPRQFRKMEVARPQGAATAERLVASLVALALVAALFGVGRAVPQALSAPFPWQKGERAALVQNQRESLFLKIEGAAKTFFLLEGRFPDRLSQLAAAGLLSPADLRDPGGGSLDYSAHEESYALQAMEKGKPLPDGETTGSIAGNFLLDPQLLTAAPSSAPPIILLD